MCVFVRTLINRWNKYIFSTVFVFKRLSDCPSCPAYVCSWGIGLFFWCRSRTHPTPCPNILWHWWWLGSEHLKNTFQLSDHSVQHLDQRLNRYPHLGYFHYLLFLLHILLAICLYSVSHCSGFEVVHKACCCKMKEAPLWLKKPSCNVPPVHCFCCVVPLL